MARLTTKDRKRIFASLAQRDGKHCCECKVPHRVIWRRSGIYGSKDYQYTRVNASSNLDIEHRIPVAQGGKNMMSNLQLMCTDCHKRKTAAERRSGGREK